jgi:hypothetical protein
MKPLKFITMWVLMILTALFMPVLTLCHVEVKVSAKRK